MEETFKQIGGQIRVGLLGRIGLRDWSLITGRGGGLQNGKGREQVKFYPYKKGRGGAEKVSIL